MFRIGKFTKDRAWVVLDALTVILPVVLAIFGSVAVISLLLNSFNAYYIVVLGVIISIPVSLYIYRQHSKFKKTGSTLENKVVITLLSIFILVWVGVNFKFNSQHVFTNRDPATYTIAAKWLTNHDSIHIDRLNEFEATQGIKSTSAGFGVSREDQTKLFAQGTHILPALLATGGVIAGDRFIFNFNIVIGAIAIMALFALTRLIVAPKWALLVAVTLGLSLPMIYFSRDTYTEPLSMVFTFGSIALMAMAIKLNKALLWLIAGLLLGASVMTRIDAYISIAAVILFLMFLLVSKKSRTDRSKALISVGCFLLGVVATSVIGFLDVKLLSSGYFVNESRYIYPELILIAGLSLATLIIVWISWRTGFSKYIKDFIIEKNIVSKAVWASMIISILLATRPLWLDVYTGGFNSGTVNWLFWYLGVPATILGGIGISFMISRLTRIKTQDSLIIIAILLVVCSTALLYLVRPSISPDQIWASRRLLPIVMPGIILAAAILLDYIYSNRIKLKLVKRLKINQKVTASAIAALVICGPLYITYPFINKVSYGQYDAVPGICESLPSNSIVLWLGRARLEAPMLTRAFCGVPAVGYFDDSRGPLHESPSSKTLADFAKRAASKGLVPIVGLYDHNRDKVIINDGDALTNVATRKNGNIEQPKYTPPRNMNYASTDILMGRVLDNGDIKYMH